MPLSDQTRIARQRAKPRITEVWFAMAPLRSVVSFMQSGAHPDDEVSAMLAALAFRDGLNLSYACSTRGEGGQNVIGTEAGAALGALRTREMEGACDVLGMRMYWHSTSPDDPITDFGFSKSGDETLRKWGRDRTLARFVEIVRTERPDILCPTFLDVPGQHGHHRAMTEAAHLVMAAAAEPGFQGCDLPVWQVAKLYLPAWSGAGQAYDDDEPPPPATLSVSGDGSDPVSGWSYEAIGQQSRAFHLTQGMGRWVPPGPGRDFPLHLAETHVAGPDDRVTDGLPGTLSDLAKLCGPGDAADALQQADSKIANLFRVFPDMNLVGRGAGATWVAVKNAARTCPQDARNVVLHRLKRKLDQLARVVHLASVKDAFGLVGDDWVYAGGTSSVTIESSPDAQVDLDVPSGWTHSGGMLAIDAKAAPSDPYRAAYDPIRPDAPCLRVTHQVDGAEIEARVPLEQPPVVMPSPTATLEPPRALLVADRVVNVALRGVSADAGPPHFDAPAGWRVEAVDDGLRVSAPANVAPGRYDLPLSLGGRPAWAVRKIARPHIQPTAFAVPAQLQVQVLDVTVPEVAVGYVGGGNDRVDHWLAAMGADVTALDDSALENGVPRNLDTLVVGIFALRTRSALRTNWARVQDWVRAGGTLVTLYHRPWDDWDAATTGLAALEIGQPSLRWRITDEAAEVVHLIPEHPLLTGPNRIGVGDWSGWVKERGLYFAKSWDAAYQPLLGMADPGEAALHGALLSGDFGAGRHIHTSLILHHQMEHLVPGAFRLMANMIARR